MFIEEVIIDGFKSYATRTVVSGFDEKFNAITGLNGSGKSNILDAICFVLGISNLSHVRASSLQELVYKQGQAGVTKASVTIIFNNQDTSSSPLGYEQYEQLSISRQVVIGGRNKYLINGHTAQVSQVHNLFHSVQLNVNNPHFLIMQGRITKVLNMKPPEILAMIEEAAGTRMYENKRKTALSTMEKKGKKVEEINTILAEEITPTLEKLRNEKAQYLQWSANESEIERCERYMVALGYCNLEQQILDLEEELVSLNQDRSNYDAEMNELVTELRDIVLEIERLKEQKRQFMQGEYAESFAKEEQCGKKLVKFDSLLTNKQQLLQQELDQVTELETQLEESSNSRAQLGDRIKAKEAEYGEIEAKHVSQTQELGNVQQEIQALSAGVCTKVSKDQSLASTLGDKQKRLAQTQTSIKQCQMKLAHAAKKEKQLTKNLKSSGKENTAIAAKVSKLEKLTHKLGSDLSKCPFDPEVFHTTTTQRDKLEDLVLKLESELDQLSATVSAKCSFDYSLPSSKNMPKTNQIKGLIAKLIAVKDLSYACALEVASGGKLHHVAVDTEDTAKALLKHGNLKRRVTFLPLNQIKHSVIPDSTMAKAQTLGSCQSALSLLEYAPEVAPAIEHVFGKIFICDSTQVAKNVTFHPDIKIKSVTKAGDVFDPHGTLTGGSSGGSSGFGTLLTNLQTLVNTTLALEEAQTDLDQVLSKLQTLTEHQLEFDQLSGNLEIQQQALASVQKHQVASVYGQLSQELESTKTEVQELQKEMQRLQKLSEELEQEIETLHQRITTFEHSRERASATLETQVQTLKSALTSSESRKKQVEAELNVERLELEHLEHEHEQLLQQKMNVKTNLTQLREELEGLERETQKCQEDFEQLKSLSSKTRAELLTCDTALANLEKKREAQGQSKKSFEASHKKTHANLSLKTQQAGELKAKLAQLEMTHVWLLTEKSFFHQPSTEFDFASNGTTSQMNKRLASLHDIQKELGKVLNKKVMGMIDKAEEEYRGLIQKREIIKRDKVKIQHVIGELDVKKSQTLETTWKKVNSDFHKIFSTLLPGSSAKLHPTFFENTEEEDHQEEGKLVDFENDSDDNDENANPADEPSSKGQKLQGLQVKVAFGQVWKESLTELSGGQRSLLALSLILALLLFNPAPMYILDEVDAALDLSHTQNIGQMIAKHFKHSQFIVVSLKEGMFNNADVVFRTKFVDGVSTVSRTTTTTAATIANPKGSGVQAKKVLRRSGISARR